MRGTKSFVTYLTILQCSFYFPKIIQPEITTRNQKVEPK